MILDFNDFLFKKWPKSSMLVSVFFHLLGLFRGARRYGISNLEVTNQKIETFIGICQLEKSNFHKVQLLELIITAYLTKVLYCVFSDSLEVSKLRSLDTLHIICYRKLKYEKDPIC